MGFKAFILLALMGALVVLVSGNEDSDEEPADWTTYEGDNWGVKVKPFVYVNDDVRYGRLDGEVRYDINDRVSVTGSGWRDTTRNWGAGVGIRYRWRRDLVHMTQGRYHLRIDASPCQFLVYDLNKDGIIDKQEMLAVFEDQDLATSLFRDLDGATGDGLISKEEFYSTAPKIIYGCNMVLSSSE